MANPLESDPDRPAPASEGHPLQLLEEDYLKCIHCGLCTSACPTYVETGQEPLSPRGRIHLIRALAEERIDWDQDVVHSLETCLACRACETACPSGVEYGILIEGAREVMEREGRRPAGSQRFLSLVRDHILPYPRRVAPLVALARLTSALLARIPGLKRLLPEAALQGIAGLPAPGPDDARPLPQRTEPLGEHQRTVILLPGCVASVVCRQTNWATLRVLAANGCRVIVPEAAGCCGSFHLHTGAADRARRMARALIAACEPYDADAILTNAAGCGSTLKEYGKLLAGDPEWARRAAAFADRMEDVHCFLVADGWEPPPATDGKWVVAYHDACHLAHAQGIRSEPREVLDALPGLRRVHLEGSELCCGSAGIYSLVEPDLAQRLLDRKLAAIVDSGAEAVAAGNPGCLLQIRAGIAAKDLPIEVYHPLELVDAAYRASGRYRRETFWNGRG